MLNTVIKYWLNNECGFYIDCTFGLGGHTKHLLSKLKAEAKVVGIDIDNNSEIVGQELEQQDSRFKFVKLNFADFFHYWKVNNLPKVNSIFFDLGYSTVQIHDENRGFSYKYTSDLDMTIDQKNKKSAAYILNTYAKNDLYAVFKKYGEFKNPRKLVDNIAEFRRATEIKTTQQFDQIIEFSLPVNKFAFNKNPKKLFYQALRMEANDELKNLETALSYLANILQPNGHALFLTFNSIEEQAIKKWISQNCTQIVIHDYCHNMNSQFTLVDNKCFLPTKKEIYDNWSARSAKLWVFKKQESKSEKN